jgi:hypothetical protein
MFGLPSHYHFTQERDHKEKCTNLTITSASGETVISLPWSHSFYRIRNDAYESLNTIAQTSLTRDGVTYTDIRYDCDGRAWGFEGSGVMPVPIPRPHLYEIYEQELSVPKGWRLFDSKHGHYLIRLDGYYLESPERTIDYREAYLFDQCVPIEVFLICRFYVIAWFSHVFVMLDQCEPHPLTQLMNNYHCCPVGMVQPLYPVMQRHNVMEDHSKAYTIRQRTQTYVVTPSTLGEVLLDVFSSEALVGVGWH